MHIMHFLLNEDLVAVDAFCGEAQTLKAFSRGAKLDPSMDILNIVKADRICYMFLVQNAHAVTVDLLKSTNDQKTKSRMNGESLIFFKPAMDEWVSHECTAA